MANICGPGCPGYQERVILLDIEVMFGAQVSGPRAPTCRDSRVFPGPRMGGGVGAKVGNDRGDALGMGEQTLNDLAFLG